MQKFPYELETPTYPDPDDPNSLRSRSEVDRRAKYFNQLQDYDQPIQDMLIMIKRCLENDAANRPSVEEVVEALSQLKMEQKLTQSLDRLELLKCVSYSDCILL